mgnify:CR=1 FL=1
MPPTMDAPEATPSNRQLMSVPALLPTMPPTVVRLPEGAQRAYLTNLLEEIQEELPIVDGKVTFMTKPFEIQTVLVK